MPRKLTLAILLILALVNPAHAAWWGSDARPPIGVNLYPAARPVGDVRFLDDHGRVMRLSDFKGRLVLINLWATWCPSCRLEMPELDRLQQLLGKDGLSVVAISLDKKGLPLVAPFYRESTIQNLPMFFDPAWDVKKQFAVEGVPASILISRDGWELARANGWQNWTSPEMLVFIRNLLERE